MKYLWKDGVCDYKVLIPENPTPTEKSAAKELVLFIGRGLRIEQDDGSGLNEEEKIISLGNTSVFRDANMNLSDVYADGYKIKTLGNTVVCGANNQSGILNSAYGFMRATWGFKVYWHDEFGVSEEKDMPLKELNLTDNPSFVGRDVNFEEVMRKRYPRYATRLRQNGVYTYINEEDGEGDGASWCHMLWAHTTLRLMPKELYFEKHRDWYSENGQMVCWTKSEVVEQMAHNLIVAISKYPHCRFFALTQTDGGEEDCCKCPTCAESHKKYGGYSGTMMRFVNAVADKVEAWRKENCPEREIYIATFGYSYTINPPVVPDGLGGYKPIDRSVVARDNVLVRIAPLYNCFNHDVMTSPCNKQFKKALLGWSAVSSGKISVYSYSMGNGAFFYPFDNFHTLQPVYRLYKKYGCIDVIDQGGSHTECSSTSALRIFLQSELLWNVDIDMTEAVKDFCAHYYRDGAPYMLEFIKTIHENYRRLERDLDEIGESFHARPSASFSMYWDRGIYYPKKFVEKLLSLLEQARRAVEENCKDEELKQKLFHRLKRESISPMYMKWMLYGGFGNTRGEKLDELDKFEKLAYECNATHYREGYRLSYKTWEFRQHYLDRVCFNIDLKNR